MFILIKIILFLIISTYTFIFIRKINVPKKLLISILLTVFFMILIYIRPLFVDIRLVLLLIVASFIILKIKNSKIVRKKLITVLSIIFCFMSISVMSALPVENLFIDFKTPEDVFSYSYSYQIDEIIDGQESCMLKYQEKKSKYGYCFIPKTNKGYKIPHYLQEKKVSEKLDSNGYFEVYNVKETNDYYISATVILKEGKNGIEIYNGKNEKIESKIIMQEGYAFVYSFLPEYPKNYYMLINGRKVMISN